MRDLGFFMLGGIAASVFWSYVHINIQAKLRAARTKIMEIENATVGTVKTAAAKVKSELKGVRSKV